MPPGSCPDRLRLHPSSDTTVQPPAETVHAPCGIAFSLSCCLPLCRSTLPFCLHCCGRRRRRHDLLTSPHPGVICFRLLHRIQHRKLIAQLFQNICQCTVASCGVGRRKTDIRFSVREEKQTTAVLCIHASERPGTSHRLPERSIHRKHPLLVDRKPWHGVPHFLTGEVSKSAQIQCGPILFVFLLLFRICLQHTAGFDKIPFEIALKSAHDCWLFSDCFMRYKARYTEDLSTFLSIFQRPKGPSGFCRRGLPCLSAVRSPFDRMIVVAPADRRHAVRQRLIGRGRHLTAVQIDHEIVPVDQAVFVRRVVVAAEHQIAQ